MRSQARGKTGSSISLEQIQAVWMIALVCLAPWPIGCVAAPFELFLTQGLVVLLALSCARLVMQPDLLHSTLQRGGWVSLAWVALIAAVLLPLVPGMGNLGSLLAPAVSDWIAQAQPAEREVLVSSGVAIPPPQTTFLSGGLSLNPSGNWQFGLRLAALCLLFLSCLSLPRPQQVLQQLAWVGVGLGSLLALVALLQRVSPDQQIYWYFEAKGTEYGPFLNKNHYPFFANLAIGLTLGLLMERWTKFGITWKNMISDTTTLWLLTAVVIQFSSLVMSLSRAGVASLITAVAIVVFVRSKRGRISTGALAGVIVAILAGGLMVWAGFDLLASRMMTLTEADTYREDGRWYLWKAAVAVIPQFFWFGSGGETFRHWETIIQFPGPWSSETTFAHRADNEYLDVLTEHGVLAMLGLLATVGLIISTGWQRIRANGLVAGAMIGLLCVALHSGVDFGLRVPASGLFATVVAGLCFATCRTEQSNTSASRRGSSLVPNTRSGAGEIMGPLATLAAVVVVLGFMTLCVREKQRYAVAANQRLQAYRGLAMGDTDETQTHLQGMLAATPDDLQAHIEAARIGFVMALESNKETERQAWIDRSITACVQARDVCPLAWEPQFWIAEHVKSLASGQRTVDYLRRAHSLHPSNPTIAYLLGVEEHRLGDSKGAYRAWAAALEKSTRYLASVVNYCAEHDAPTPPSNEWADRLRRELLPSDPRSLLEAARLFADLGIAEAEQECLELAAKHQERLTSSIKNSERARHFSLSADIQVRLGKYDQAAKFLRMAIAHEPQSAGLRLRLVEALIELEDPASASKELRLAELAQPGNQRVEALRKQILALELQGQIDRAR